MSSRATFPFRIGVNLHLHRVHFQIVFFLNLASPAGLVEKFSLRFQIAASFQLLYTLLLLIRETGSCAWASVSHATTKADFQLLCTQHQADETTIFSFKRQIILHRNVALATQSDRRSTQQVACTFHYRPFDAARRSWQQGIDNGCKGIDSLPPKKKKFFFRIFEILTIIPLLCYGD